MSIPGFSLVNRHFPVCFIYEVRDRAAKGTEVSMCKYTEHKYDLNASGAKSQSPDKFLRAGLPSLVGRSSSMVLVAASVENPRLTISQISCIAVDEQAFGVQPSSSIFLKSLSASIRYPSLQTPPIKTLRSWRIAQQEMEDKGIWCNKNAFKILVNAYAVSSNIEKMEKLLMKMERDSR
uniref:Pentatricopeptide repeat-containing protein n=1 Tax=Salix viminalis TaxID=40686 RepID=A0A6N2M086_SALVM